MNKKIKTYNTGIVPLTLIQPIPDKKIKYKRCFSINFLALFLHAIIYDVIFGQPGTNTYGPLTPNTLYIKKWNNFGTKQKINKIQTYIIFYTSIQKYNIKQFNHMYFLSMGITQIGNFLFVKFYLHIWLIKLIAIYLT